MPLTENLAAFFDAFAVPVVAGAVTGKGILDAPTNVMGDGMVLSNDYVLTVRTDEFGALQYGDALTVSGVSYTVRDTRQVDDGKLSEISLMRP